MKTALILHGICPEEEFFFSKYPSPSNAWWLPWLQQQFLRAGWQCQTPELPHPYRPSYAEWKETFECFKPQKLSLLVGHSAGGGFAIKYLQEHKLKLEKLILVAPWLDPEREFDDFLKKMEEYDVQIGVLTVPIEIAQCITDMMVDGGIKAVWNFTPFRIRVPEDIVVQNTSLYAHLAVMFNRLNFNEIK